MPRIKDIPKIDRPREKFLKKGADALSKSDLLAILLGSGIKGKNVRQLSENIIKKFGKNFLNITVNDLLEISGIGQAKALQIVSAISLVKRFYADEKSNEVIIKNSQDVLSLTYDLRDKKKEHLLCLYLNARNSLLKKEIISVGLLDKTLLHPREIFYPATELNAASAILIHNHPSGDSSPSEKDIEVVEKITQAGEIMGIPVIDFIIISTSENYSFFEKLQGQNRSFDYVAGGLQGTLFDLLEIEKSPYEVTIKKIEKPYFHFSKAQNNTFQLQNRRYLGNKYKLLGFIEDIVSEKCNEINSFCDIFAGIVVEGKRFNFNQY
ncbi:DNA repair protein RadC [Patescibacteria group bacterium]|nr:DNA repair protein RadC [Patescibacteria group bacterium]MBU4099126.1 DNA repair protein RadC [Patescibacteria group bacterium]